MSSDLQVIQAGGTLRAIVASELEQQIATARRYPRSVKQFLDRSVTLVTLTEETAEACIYSLPRQGKVIEGPSARFAELVLSAWGNARAAARVIDDSGEILTAQGMFLDLESNTAVSVEVQRRIVDRQGRRYNPDMITVTANAACSIALRNAILRGIPRAYWDTVYQRARDVLRGSAQSIAARRAKALEAFGRLGVPQDVLLAAVGAQSLEDVTADHLVTWRGMLTALREGEITVEQMIREVRERAEEAEAEPRRKSEKQPKAAQPKAAEPEAKADNDTEPKAREPQPKSGRREPARESQPQPPPPPPTPPNPEQEAQVEPTLFGPLDNDLEFDGVDKDAQRMIISIANVKRIPLGEIRQVFGSVTRQNVREVSAWLHVQKPR
ncbi:MAG: hypothetical protein NZ518_00610 [Dehalococcoidia bacterium]|nr:hypothetical protein [Dehalococcoidia bacterium]